MRTRFATRRQLLATGTAGALVALLPRCVVAASDRMRATAGLEEGPFYPREIPLDHDNDLLRYAGQDGKPEGVPLDLYGRVLDRRGRALPEVRVEIWQCDAHGHYHYVEDADNAGKPDVAFQGYGTMTTRADGAYRFRTIRPAPYPGRTPHIHFKLRGEGFDGLTTQMFVAGDPHNARDAIYNSITDKRARAALTVELKPGPDSTGLVGVFDVVLDADGRFDQAAAIA